MTNDSNNLGSVVRQRRSMVPLTLKELAGESGVSTSYLCRIEKGERCPSARILRKMAKPLGLGEDELFVSAGYLSPKTSSAIESPITNRLDSQVVAALSQETFEIQRTVLVILSLLKIMTKNDTRQHSRAAHTES
ncbi:hypothetical protein ES703_14983 [subsurface metagenome]